MDINIINLMHFKIADCMTAYDYLNNPSYSVFAFSGT